MSNENYKIQLIFEAANKAQASFTELTNAFKSLRGQVQETDDATKKTGAGLTGLFDQMKEHWLGVTAAIAGVAIAANKAFDYMELGAKAEQAEASFRQVAAASKENADQIIADMKRASNGTVDDSDIMQKAVKGMIQGLSGDQLVKIMEAARIGARVAGEDVKTAYEGITDAIANKLPKGLIRYGLISQEQRKVVSEAMALGISDFNVYAIAMENAGKQSKILSNLQEDNAEKMQQWHAQMNDLKENIGKTIWDSLLPILKDIESWFKKNPATIREWAASFVEAITTIKAEVMRLSMLLDKLGGTLTSAGMLLFGPGAALGNNNSKKQFEALAQANIDYEARFNATDKELQNMALALNDRLESIRNPPAELNARPSTKTDGTNATQEIKALIDAAKLKPETLGPDRSNLKAWEESQAALAKEAAAWKAAQEGAINYQLSLIDIAEQERSISKEGATEKRIELNKKLLGVQEEYNEKLATMGQEDTAAWYAQQGAIAKTREELLKLNMKSKELTGTFFEGFKDALELYSYNVKTAFQEGVKLAQDAAQAMEQAFSDFFFDVFTGKLKHFSDYLKSFFDAVARAMANAMAQKTSVAIASGIANIWGGGSSTMTNASTGSEGLTVGHTGGYIMHAGGLIPRFHIGGLASDERPIIAQTGEGVLSRKGMAAFDRLNQGGDMGGGKVPNFIVNVENKGQPMDAKAGSIRYDQQAEAFVVGVVMKNLEYGGPIRSGISTIK